MINPESKLAEEFWQKGRAEDCPIFDFHGHMGDDGGLFIPKKSAEDMLDTMDSCNTIMTMFCGHESLFIPTIGVEKDIAVVRKYPHRFKAYHAVVSQYLKPDEDIGRVRDNPDIFVGFKFLCDYYGYPLSHPIHRPYFEYANKNKLLVLSHTWNSVNNGGDEIEKVLKDFPDLILIAGHSIHGDWRRAVDLVKKYPNIYLELTAVLDDRGPLELFVKETGSERILFGTDLPWFSTHHGIGAVLSAKIDDEDRRNIFYRNGIRLLKRFTWFDKIYKDNRLDTLM